MRCGDNQPAARQMRDARVSSLGITQGGRLIGLVTIRDMSNRVVAEGRDITTVVVPDADARILLTASEEARLGRRGLQLGGSQNDAQLANQVLARDAKDSTVVNFTQAADGVMTVDSSDLDFEQTINAVLDAINTATKN